MIARRQFGITRFGAAAASGVSMALVVAEIANRLLGFTPSPQRYPVATDLRGVVGHLVYGFAVAALVEAGWKLAGPALRVSSR
jgi:uncharacterized membrane protein YagU involved in acid resistance